MPVASLVMQGGRASVHMALFIFVLVSTKRINFKSEMYNKQNLVRDQTHVECLITCYDQHYYWKYIYIYICMYIYIYIYIIREHELEQSTFCACKHTLYWCRTKTYTWLLSTHVTSLSSVENLISISRAMSQHVSLSSPWRLSFSVLSIHLSIGST